jgi:hypothetical protein
MKKLGKWMLGAALAVGALGFGANTAHAARIGVYVGAPVAYVPPCPGPGYVWVAGYWNPYHVWVPGYWNARPVVRFGGPVVVGHFGGYGHYHRR